MADSAYRTRAHELDDDEIRMLLPRGLLEEIGVGGGPAPQRVPDPVDGLTAHLASVLGGARKKTPCRRHPQVNVGRACGSSPAGGEGGVLRRVAAPPPSPAVPWQVMESLRRRNAVVLHPTTTMPALTTPLAGGGAPPATTTAARRGVGTGVFLPRADDEVAVRGSAKAATSPSNGNRADRIIHQRGQQAAMVIVKTQKKEVRAVAALMEQRYCLGVVDPHPELPLLPQEWTY